MAAASNRLSTDIPSSDTRPPNITRETLAALRVSAFRNLESSVMADIGDRRSIDMDGTRGSLYLPNLTFADQFESARKTLSIGSYVDESYGGTDVADVTENFTKTHLRLLLDEDPGWKATEALYDDFLRFLIRYPGQQQVFELLRHYEELCSDQVLILRKIIERGAPGKQRFVRTVEMLHYMEAELWTWRLIRMVYEDRLKPTGEDNQLTEEEVQSLTDLEKWHYLYEHNQQFREMRLVVQWCQQNAADLLGVQEPGNIFGEKLFLWENTLHRLKTTRSTSMRPFIRSMDPDAPLREGARLDDTDQADEQRLLNLVFCYIRAGQMDKAVDLCVNSGQAWRGAALKSALPFHRQQDQQRSNGEIVGNASRDIWKRMVWQACDNSSLPLIERAIYGSLSGHFGAMRSSCGSWEDILWAYAVAASEHMLDDFIRRTASTKKRKLADMPSTAPLNEDVGKYSFNEILRELEASDDEKVSQESKSAFRRLQSYILLDKPDIAVSYMHEYMVEYADDIPKHLVRLMAHVVIAFKLCSLDIPFSPANSILEHYVKLLIDDQRAELVAFYTAALPLDAQTYWYAKFLENVEDNEKRMQYLSLAEKAGLDVSSICVAVVCNIRQTFEPVINDSVLSTSGDEGIEAQSMLMTAKMTADVSENDRRLVKAIEWLLFDSVLHGEAVKHANAIGRILLLGRNFAAVQELFAFLPPDVLQSATDAWLIAEGKGGDLEDHQLSLEHQNMIREFLCHQAYLEAHTTFRRWFEHYHRKKPQLAMSDLADMGVATGALSFQQKAAAEFKGRQHEEKMKEWERDLQILAEDAVQTAYNVLQYPDGGWMVDESSGTESTGVQTDTTERERVEELELLRKRCLPLITDMLIAILQGSGRYKEALKLADMIVSEETCLYQVFTKDQLKHVNRKLADISVEALNQGYSCLGYGQ